MKIYQIYVQDYKRQQQNTNQTSFQHLSENIACLGKQEYDPQKDKSESLHHSPNSVPL